MKGKFKGKILNLRNIIVSLIIVGIAVVSGISIVQYKTQNVETNLDEANNITNYVDFDGSDIVQKAIYLANGGKNGTGYNTNTVSGGCTGFVNAVLNELSSNLDSLEWVDQKVLTGFQTGTSCFEIIKNNGIDLVPGDILWRI